MKGFHLLVVLPRFSSMIALGGSTVTLVKGIVVSSVRNVKDIGLGEWVFVGSAMDRNVIIWTQVNLI